MAPLRQQRVQSPVRGAGCCCVRVVSAVRCVGERVLSACLHACWCVDSGLRTQCVPDAAGVCRVRLAGWCFA